jgi:diguanylate cyclase (GGDEF)-like protein
VEDQVIGVINAESETVGAFSEQDEALLTILAGQLSTAIQRLRTARAEQNQSKQLSRSNALIRALAQLGAQAAAAPDPDGVMATLGNELAKLGLRCLIALCRDEEAQAFFQYTSLPKHLVATVERISSRKFQDYAIPLERFTPASDQHGPVLVTDPVALVGKMFPDLSRPVAAKFLKALGVIATTSIGQLPLVSEGKLIGVLWMWGEGLHEGDLPTLSLFASQVATALRNANLLAEVQRLAITDELTGVFNRRYFFNRAEVEFSRAKRYSHPLTALIADIDHFKQFNDRYGHLVGDRVIQEVARLMKTSLRDSDILGRYGGEEFSILLPDTNVQAAAFVADRLLTRVGSTSIDTEAGDLQVQISIGVAGLGKATPTLHDLINRADQAMYQAKEEGRNRVAVK